MHEVRQKHFRLGSLQLVVWLVLLSIAPAVSYGVGVWHNWPCASPGFVVESTERSVWMITRGGVVRWDKQAGNHTLFTRFETGGCPAFWPYASAARRRGEEVLFGRGGLVSLFGPEGERQRWHLEHGCGTKLAVDSNGVVWALNIPDGTSTTIAVFDGRGWSYLRWPENLRALCSSQDGRVWFAADGAFISFDGEQVHRYACPPGGEWFWDISADARGCVWAIAGTDVYKLDPPKEQWMHYDLSHLYWLGLGDQVEVTRDGRVWLPSSRAGLVCFDGEQTTSFGLDREDLGGLCAAISIDPDGTNIWVVNPYRGLFLFDRRRFQNKPVPADLLRLPLCAAEGPDGRVWFGTDGSLVGFYEDGWHWPLDMLKPGVGRSTIDELRMLSARSLLVLMHPGGLYAVDDAWRVTPMTLDCACFSPSQDFEIDSSGAIWVCCGPIDGGVCRLDPGTRNWEYFGEGDTGLFYAEDIEPDPIGGVWVGGLGGLVRWDGAGWEKVTNAVGSAAHSLNYDDDGVLWAGTEIGAWSFDGEQWRHYTASNSGIFPGRVGLVRVDSSNRKWFAGPAGVAVLDGNQWRRIDTGNSPLLSDSLYDILSDRAGRVWFCTSAGVSLLQDRPGAVSLALAAHKGDRNGAARVVLCASCENRLGLELVADLFLWAELADGTRVYLPRVSTEEHPIFSRLAIPDGFAVENVSIYSVDLTDIPRGHYVIKALLTNHGCLASPLSNEAVAEFDW